MLAHVDESTQEVIRLTPDKAHPVHKGFACHKGLNYVELHKDPDRLNHPQVRQSPKGTGQPKFKRIGWDEAIDGVSQRIHELQEQHGADALGFYIGNPSAFNSSGRAAVKQFARAVGAKYSFGSGTQDCTNKFAASEGVFGTANLHPIPDFKHTQYFLSLGSNPKISHASFVHMTDPMAAIRGIVKRGGKVVHINPRKIESASPATGDVVQIKPDTDVYFLAALIAEIKLAGLVEEAWIDGHAANADELWRFVSSYDADTVAPVVGISADTIRQIAHEFAQASSASIHMSTGVNMGRQGTLAYWLVQMLSLVTGNLGKKGGNIYSPGYFEAASVGKPKTDDPFYESEFGEMRRIAGSLPGNLLADHIEQGLVKGLIVMSGNPLLSMAGESRLQAAFARLELVVVVDIYPNATALHADYLLPATDWLERSDINALSLGFQPEPYVQIADPVVPAQHERAQEWWMFARLLQALNQPSILDTDNPEAQLEARLDRQLQHSNLSVSKLRAAPQNTVRLPDPDPNIFFRSGVQNAENRVNCAPDIVRRGFDECAQQFAALGAEDPGTLKLITLRTNYMVNSWLHNLRAFKRDHVLDNPLHMHPNDIDAREISAGCEVMVSTQYGQIIAVVKADETLREGVVAMTHGWGHGDNLRLGLASNHPGTNVNAILPTGLGSYDPLSNMSHMTGIPVEVRAT